MSEPQLKPTEWLMMEVLAARRRLGEATWTFPSQFKRQAKVLQELDYVWWKHGTCQGTILVVLTDKGFAAATSPAYKTAGRGGLHV